MIVASAGDVNGDGIDDFIVGAHLNDDGVGASQNGAAYIFFGSTALTGTKSLGAGQSADVTIVGKASNDQLGGSVSSAGDVNGDGLDDIIVGAPNNQDGGGSRQGAVYIFFGSASLSGTKDLGRTGSADVTFLGKAALDELGGSVSGAGDVNGDGFDDVIMGAALNNDGGTDDEGAAYIFFGSSTLGGTKRLGGADSADVTILGEAVNDFFGYPVSGAGDINGDGFDDVIMASAYNDTVGNLSGAAYVLFGASNLSGTIDLGGGAPSVDITILGKAAGDYFGAGPSGVGDIDDDGFDDFAVSAKFNSDGALNGGAAYIFFGGSDLSGTINLSTTSSADVTVLANNANDNLGIATSGIGDVNADGLPDFIVGANFNDDGVGANNNGAAYIIFGATNLSGTFDMGAGPQTADVTFLGKNALDRLGQGLGGGRSNPGP